MNPCTQNVLASIRAGNTIVESWQQYKQHMERKGLQEVDDYHLETYQGACEALSILEQEAAQQAS